MEKGEEVAERGGEDLDSLSLGGGVEGFLLGEGKEGGRRKGGGEEEKEK